MLVKDHYKHKLQFFFLFPQGQLILTTTQRATTYGGSVLLVGGVALLAFMVFSYYRSRN